MAEENGKDFALGAIMGVGCGLLAGIVVIAALAYFAPQFLGLTPRNGQATTAHAMPRLWD